MNFELSEDESLLKGVAERFVADRYGVERRREHQLDLHGFSNENWGLLGDLGILSAAIPEDGGGLGLGPAAIFALVEALGRGLVAEPVVECAILAAPLLAEYATNELRAELGEGLAFGTRRIALAHAEGGSRNGSLWVETRAGRNGSGVVLNGHKPFVAAGAGVDGFIVSARNEGAAQDRQGLSLYFVPADASGLNQSQWRMADGIMAASLTLNNVAVGPGQMLGGDAIHALREAELRASLARSAEALGIMERLFADTLDYVRQREQFGSPLGKFQVVQHRLAAQYARLEQARALLELAVMAHRTPGHAAAVDGARAYIAEASLELGHEAIQFHGGMGVTDELAIGHGHKRLLVLSRWPDNAETALDRYAG